MTPTNFQKVMNYISYYEFYEIDFYFVLACYLMVGGSIGTFDPTVANRIFPKLATSQSEAHSMIAPLR